MKKTGQKIGIFDSGLGGLYIARAVRAALPDYDYVYLGDTLHVPYGPRSDEAIYALSEAAMRHLFAQDCAMVLMACNTASAAALRALQQGFLARDYPDRRILGVIVPTLEAAIESGYTRIGLIATARTAASGIYEAELKKINPAIELHTQATPLLVPLMEQGGEAYLDQVLGDYLAPLADQAIDGLILGCTHYAGLKARIGRHVSCAVFSQDDIIPAKTADYLSRHPEMAARLSRGGTMSVHVTDLNDHFSRNISALWQDDIMPVPVSL